jgi:hypothetical protein
MKVAFWLVIMVSAAMGAIASCGPERKFCPDMPPDYECRVNLDSSANGGTGGGGACLPGFKFVLVDAMGVCVPEDGGM